MNVAVSRAMENCVIVADLDFVSHVHSATSPARQLIEIASKNGVVMPAGQYLQAITSDWLRFDEWSAAQQRISNDILASESAPVHIVLPHGFALSETLRDAIAAASSKTEVVVFCDTSVAMELEDTQADLRLQDIDEGFTVVCGDLMWIGGRRESLVARLGHSAPRTLISSKLRGALAKRLTTPELSAILQLLGGRCPDCTASRALRALAGTIFAVCTEDEEHPPSRLEDPSVLQLLNQFGISCPQCGSRARAEKSPLGFRYSCSRDSRQCGDHLPTIDDILP
jgi:hypothetical protein